MQTAYARASLPVLLSMSVEHDLEYEITTRAAPVAQVLLASALLLW